MLILKGNNDHEKMRFPDFRHRVHTLFYQSTNQYYSLSYIHFNVLLGTFKKVPKSDILCLIIKHHLCDENLTRVRATCALKVPV